MSFSDRLAVLSIVTPLSLSLFGAWWKHRRVVQAMIDHFQRMRDQFDGIRSIIRDKTNRFQIIGPRGFAMRLGTIKEELDYYDRLKDSFWFLFSSGLKTHIRNAEDAAGGMYGQTMKLAKPWVDNITPWGDDPAAIGCWSLHAQFIDNTIDVLDSVLANLRGTRLVHTLEAGQ